MKVDHATSSHILPAAVLGVVTIAACATVFQLPAGSVGRSDAPKRGTLGVQDKRANQQAMQVMLFVHRHGVALPTVKEGHE